MRWYCASATRMIGEIPAARAARMVSLTFGKSNVLCSVSRKK